MDKITEQTNFLCSTSFFAKNLTFHLLPAFVKVKGIIKRSGHSFCYISRNTTALFNQNYQICYLSRNTTALVPIKIIKCFFIESFILYTLYNFFLFFFSFFFLPYPNFTFIILPSSSFLILTSPSLFFLLFFNLSFLNLSSASFLLEFSQNLVK